MRAEQEGLPAADLWPVGPVILGPLAGFGQPGAVPAAMVLAPGPPDLFKGAPDGALRALVLDPAQSPEGHVAADFGTGRGDPLLQEGAEGVDDGSARALDPFAELAGVAPAHVAFDGVVISTRTRGPRPGTNRAGRRP